LSRSGSTVDRSVAEIALDGRLDLLPHTSPPPQPSSSSSSIGAVEPSSVGAPVESSPLLSMVAAAILQMDARIKDMERSVTIIDNRTEQVP
jgi:hypothetical protein